MYLLLDVTVAGLIVISTSLCAAAGHLTVAIGYLAVAVAGHLVGHFDIDAAAFAGHLAAAFVGHLAVASAGYLAAAFAGYLATGVGLLVVHCYFSFPVEFVIVFFCKMTLHPNL
ncbi:hypothetical protein G9A89_015975 [Geosiphon pyriformis]|nr:hypothetical protein G9A89_015975 [Geosiphon pyriformis]